MIKLRTKKPRKIPTTCNHCGTNAPGTYARITLVEKVRYYCVLCYPLIARVLDSIDPKGMWPSVIEMLQHDENQREPGTWSIIQCDADKQMKIHAKLKGGEEIR